MNFENIAQAEVIQAIGWSLVHVLWQASLLALALAAALAMLKDRNASIRYMVSCAALVLTVALPIATAINAYEKLPEPPKVAAAAATPKPIVEFKGIAIEASIKQTFITASDKIFNWRETLEETRAALQSMLPWIVRLWCIGVVLFSIRLAIGLVRTRRVVAHGTAPASPEWQRIAQRLSDQLNIRGGVRLLESAIVEVPTVVGWVRPAILIPVSAFTGLSAEQLETIIAHELAHIRRHDFLINLLQSVVETLLFYHPAVWWISRQVRIERENCCDDLAVAICGDPVIYAHALTSLEQLRSDVPDLALAATGGSLLSRIRRLVGAKDGGTRNETWFAGVSLGVLVLILVMALPLRTLALQIKGDDPKKAEPKKSGTSVTVEARGTVDRSDEEETHAEADDDEDYDYDVDVDVDSDVDIDPDIDVEIEEEAISDAVNEAVAAVTANITVNPIVAVAPQIAIAAAEGEWDFDIDFDHDDDPAGSKKRMDKDRVADFSNLSVDDLVHLRNIGVDAAYVRELQSVGFEHLTYRELISLRSMGVDASYIKEMRATFGPNLKVKELVSLKSMGVDASYAKEMRGYFGNDLSIKELVSLKAMGVDGGYVREMKAAGITDLSPKNLTRLRAHGVDTKVIRGIRNIWKDASIDDVVKLKSVGVDAEWLKALEAAGYPGLTVKDAASMRSVGVDAHYIREMKASGYPNLSARDLVKLRSLGVDPDYIRGMAAAGFRNLTVDQLVKLRAHGVEADYMKRLSAEGFGNLTVDDLIRLKSAGVDEEFIREMKSLSKKTP